jgi:hypothetical protein
LEAVLIVIGCAIVASTAALTASRYGELPARVPIHFGISGVADRYGPRPAVWLLVGVQLLIGAIFAVMRGAGGLALDLLIGDCLLAVFAWVQVQIVSLAISGKDRLAMVPFWAMIGGIVVLSILAPHFRR